MSSPLTFHVKGTYSPFEYTQGMRLRCYPTQGIVTRFDLDVTNVVDLEVFVGNETIRATRIMRSLPMDGVVYWASLGPTDYRYTDGDEEWEVPPSLRIYGDWSHTSLRDCLEYGEESNESLIRMMEEAYEAAIQTVHQRG